MENLTRTQIYQLPGPADRKSADDMPGINLSLYSFVPIEPTVTPTPHLFKCHQLRLHAAILPYSVNVLTTKAEKRHDTRLERKSGKTCTKKKKEEP